MSNETGLLFNLEDSDTLKALQSFFPDSESADTDHVLGENHKVVVYELTAGETLESIGELLETNNFFLLLAPDSQIDSLVELSKEHFFSYINNKSTISELIIRINNIKKFSGRIISLLHKNEELENTIFELAFASTNVLEQNEFLEQMANKDGLTMLFNHSYFKENLAKEFDRAYRYGKQFALALLDLDNFKNVNDRHGHLKGDEVLKKVASVIMSNVRTTDIPARYGGEEFAIIFTETDIEAAEYALNRIKQSLSEVEFEGELESFFVTFSAGLTVFSSEYKNTEEMINLVDNALYHSKNNGKDQITVVRYGETCD